MLALSYFCCYIRVTSKSAFLRDSSTHTPRRRFQYQRQQDWGHNSGRVGRDDLEVARDIGVRLMSARLSNREIADELYLSVNTVKWYARSIYDKLGAANRRETGLPARELAIF